MYRRIFLDANILADLYDTTRPSHSWSKKSIAHLLSVSHVALFTSCDIITTLYYIASKKDKDMALDFIMMINQWCGIVEFGSAEVTKSCRLMKQNRQFTDLEDTIQYVMARKIEADLILSNDKRFTSDGIDLMNTEQFCHEFL